MVQSKLLLKYKNLIHYFLNREDMLILDKFISRGSKLITTQQTHGNRIVTVNETNTCYYKDYDGMITKINSVYLGVYTADCMPIIYFDENNKRVGLLHAGWKGLYKGIITNFINLMIKLGSNPMNITCVIGPHIRACCYNVSFQRVKLFNENEHLSDNCRYYSGNWYLNLEEIARNQMLKLKILNDNLDILPYCTYCDKNFSSNRREGSITERMISLVHLNR